MENKYNIAVVTKPNNYFPINLRDLKISNNYNTDKLEELDNFTLKYTKNDIMNAIKEANLLDINEDMSLVIIYYEKNDIRTLPILTKEISFDMWKYIKDNYEDKNFKNKVFNFLNNKVEINNLKSAKDLNEFLMIISGVPYIIKRKLYFYLYEK